MHRIMRTGVAGLALALVLAALPALAAEGRIPLWQPTALAGPGINGKYIVTRNIAGAGGPVISVVGTGNENIDIDLNGMTLTGGLNAHVIDVSNVKTFVVRNGTIESGPDGPAGDAVHLVTAGEIVIEDLTIQPHINTGIYISQSAPEVAFAIRRNIINEPSGDGIMIMGFGESMVFTGSIEDNVIKEAVGSGITVQNPFSLIQDHSSVAIRNNRVHATLAGPGIHLLGNSSGDTFIGNCLVIENTVIRAGTEGIYLDHMSDCKIHNNVIYESACNGIRWVGGGNGLISDNIASNNGFNGVLSSSFGHHVDKNVMNENQCFGLHLAGGSHNYGRNSARNNLGADPVNCPTGGACDPFNCTNFSFPMDCWPGNTGPPPGPGNTAPDYCNTDPFGSNHTFCDNLMPGPPPS